MIMLLKKTNFLFLKWLVFGIKIPLKEYRATLKDQIR